MNWHNVKNRQIIVRLSSDYRWVVKKSNNKKRDKKNKNKNTEARRHGGGRKDKTN